MYQSKIYVLFRNGGIDTSNLYLLYLANYFRLIERLEHLSKDDERLQEVVADLRSLTQMLAAQLRDEYSRGPSISA